MKKTLLQLNSSLYSGAGASTGLADEFVAGVAQHPRRIVRSPFIGRVGVGIENAAIIAERAPGDYHPRAIEKAAIDRLAHCHIGEPFTARDCDAGYAGA